MTPGGQPHSPEDDDINKSTASLGCKGQGQNGTNRQIRVSKILLTGQHGKSHTILGV